MLVFYSVLVWGYAQYSYVLLMLVFYLVLVRWYEQYGHVLWCMLVFYSALVTLVHFVRLCSMYVVILFCLSHVSMVSVAVFYVQCSIRFQHINTRSTTMFYICCHYGYGQDFCILQTNQLGIQLFNKHALCPFWFLIVNNNYAHVSKPCQFVSLKMHPSDSRNRIQLAKELSTLFRPSKKNKENSFLNFTWYNCFHVNILEFLVSISLAFSQLYIYTC